MNKNKKILIVDDEPAICEILSSSLEDEEYKVKTKHDGISALETLKSFQPHIVLLDIWMPRGKLDGIELLKKVKTPENKTDFIIMSGHGNIETAVKAIKLGAWDFIEKPLSINKILILIKNLLSYQEEREEKLYFLNKLKSSMALIGSHPKILQMKLKMARTASSRAWVLIQGERGTGKKTLAQNIHYLSPQASQDFVEFSCSSYPEEFLYQELFGCHKQSFEDNFVREKGKCDDAKEGTLYLNEITSLNRETQEALLHLLETQSFKRKNGSAWISSPLRVIASTNKHLRQEVKKGKFNKALFEHLSALFFEMPPLRERASDIPLLIDQFSEQFRKDFSFNLKAFSQKTFHEFLNHSWPGNIRELKNRVERAFIMASSQREKTSFPLGAFSRQTSTL